MTIKHKYFAIMAMIVMILMIITSFNTVDVSAATQKAKLNKKEMTVYVGKTANLKMLNTSKNVKWSTSKKTIASVNQYGKVTAKKAGKATITAKVAGKKYTCKVTVKNPKLNFKSLTLKKGSTKQLKLLGSKIETVSSSNKNIVTVSKSGKLKALKVGKATITVKGSNKKTYKCSVTVKGNKKNQLVYAKKAFPNCYIPEERYVSNSSVTAGKYEARFVGVDPSEGYAYITLRKDKTFKYETNVDTYRQDIIAPIVFEGKYVVYARKIVDPHGVPTGSVGKAIILYVGDYQLDWLEWYADGSGFGSQSYNYLLMK